MKKLLEMRWMAVMATLMMTSFTACNEDDPAVVDDPDEATRKEILANYVDKTVIPTYKAMAEAALKMRAANEALKATPTDATMEAAAAAWMDARIWWEKSEAFLFGPVSGDGFDIDGHIDSWPLELEGIKESIEEKDGNITGEEAWEDLDAEVIGFHTTEYLLFREGKARPVADLSNAERKYLTAVTDALVWDCVLAYIAWAGENAVSAEIKAIFNENPAVAAALKEHSAYADYGQKMKTAGGGYSSYANAMTDISTGAADIAKEVGEVKIAAPYEGQHTEDVESWYSWHSLDDYQNNILSIKNAYLGGTDDVTRTSVSLSSFIAAKDTTGLDAEVQFAIENAVSKIQAIGTGGKSFYEVVRDQINADEVQAAVEACLELESVFVRVQEVIEK
jgi:uncharacterized iron-regulated protein